MSLTGLEAAHDRDYTPTGLIGSKLVQELLAANVAVRVVARDPSKLAAEVRTRVDIVRGSSDDVATLERALAGAESLFHMVARP